MALRTIIALTLFAVAASAPAAAATAPAARVKRLTVDVQLSADGRSVSTTHNEVTATNDAAAMKMGQVAIPYDAALSSLDVVSAYTLKKDGTKIPVDTAAIYDQLAPGAAQMPMFTEFHTKTIVFPQFAAGDTAVYTVRLTAKEAMLPNAYWFGQLFPRQTAYDEARETITAPASMALKIETHGVDFHKRRHGDQIVYSWHYSAPTPAPPDHVVIAPIKKTPRFYVSTFSDYRELGDAYAAAAAPKMAVTPQIQALADRLTRGLDDKRAQAKALYEWVSGHIRYVAVELGRGSLVPHAAQAVLTNGYGDCKDHVTLLGALLKAKGIASEGVLIDSGANYDLTEAPTFSGLNHIITYVPSLDLYLDSTAVVAPFGVLPFDEYGKPVVFAAPGASRRGMMPALPQGLAEVHTTTVSRLSKDGILTGTAETTGHGPYGLALRQIALGIQAAGPEDYAAKLMASRGYGGDATGTLDAPAPTRLTPGYTIKSRFTARHWKEQADGSRRFLMPGGMRVLPLSGDGLMGKFGLTGLDADARYPCYSAHASEDLSLTAPDGMHFDHTPQGTHVKTAYLRFDADWTLDGQTLHVHRDFTSRVGQPLCGAAMRAVNKDALKEISDSYDLQLMLVPAAGAPSPPQAVHTGAPAHRTKSNGSWYADAIAQPPKDANLAKALQDSLLAMHEGANAKAMRILSDMLAQPNLPISASYPGYYNRAILYARGDDLDGALSDLNKILAIVPGDDRMLKFRAAVYLRKGDHDKAMADYDTLLRNNPKDVYTAFKRGNLHLRDGQFKAAVADYDTAFRGAIVFPSGALTLRAIAERKLGHSRQAKVDLILAKKAGDTDAADFADSVTLPEPRPAASPPPDPSQPFMLDPHLTGITPPTPANVHTQPPFPGLSRRMGDDGTTVVQLTIGKNGTVSHAAVMQTSGFYDLDAAALKAVKAWRYHPATRNGKPIAVRTLAKVHYALRN